jgi:hypothetical protein
LRGGICRKGCGYQGLRVPQGFRNVTTQLIPDNVSAALKTDLTDLQAAMARWGYSPSSYPETSTTALRLEQ